MKVRKIQRYDNGVKAKSSKFYAVFADHMGVMRKLPLFEDRKASEEAGRKVDRLVDTRAANDTPDGELSRWLESTAPAIREKLAEWNIIATTRLAAGKPLSQHIDDWQATLTAKGNTPRHVEQIVERVRKVVEGCGFVFWNDITASRVQAYLHGLRNEGKGIGAQTFNFYLQNMKQFGRWMVKDGRASESTLTHLSGLNVKTDRRHDRRAFTVDEFRWLIASTEAEPARWGMTGIERALLYRLAVETGFRRAELASLTKDSFELVGEQLGVTVGAKDAKARRSRRSPLRADLAPAIASHLERKMPGVAAFNVPPRQHTAKMLKADIDAARTKWIASAGDDETRREREATNFLCYRDDASRYLDFHALRHTRGVWLFEHHKAHPREVQELMGVSSLGLVDRYTRSFRLTDMGIAERGPDLSTPANWTATKATGTDGQPEKSGTDGPMTGKISVSASVSPRGDIQWNSVESDGMEGDRRSVAGLFEKPVKTSINTVVLTSKGGSDIIPPPPGEVAEWLNAPVSKTG